MSLLGFDAVGRLPLGAIPHQAGVVVLPATVGAFIVTGYPVSFAISEPVSAGSVALSGVAASFTLKPNPVSGAFSISGAAATFKITEAISAGSIAFTGNPVNEVILEAEGPAAFTIAGNDAALSRTGFDYDFQQGGIGHLLMEMQRAKQLAAITRTIPPPVDRRSVPTFGPAPRPLAAPIAPAIDLAAIQKQRMDEAAAASKAAKKRRDEEAILLLAS